MATVKLFEDCKKTRINVAESVKNLTDMAKYKKDQLQAISATHFNRSDLKKEIMAEELAKVFVLLNNVHHVLKKITIDDENSSLISTFKALNTEIDQLHVEKKALADEKKALADENTKLLIKTDKWVEYSNIYSKIEENFSDWKKEIQTEIGLESQVKKQVKESLKTVIKEVVETVAETSIFKKSFSEAVKNSQTAIKNEAEKTFKKSLTKALKENQNEMLESTMTRHDADQFEKEKRSRNIVISNIPESQQLDIRERIKEDTHLVAELTKVPVTSIEKCYRAGPPLGAGSNVDRVRPRPLIIILESPDMARQLHKYGNGAKIIHKGEDYWINPDLTRTERRANYNARTLRKQRENTTTQSTVHVDEEEN